MKIIKLGYYSEAFGNDEINQVFSRCDEKLNKIPYINFELNRLRVGKASGKIQKIPCLREKLYFTHSGLIQTNYPKPPVLSRKGLF